jgi:hypothetical protein
MTVDPEALRAELLAEGERLRAAQRADAQAHAAIARLLPAALEAGLSKREIARISGVSRPWMDKVLSERE